MQPQHLITLQLTPPYNTFDYVRGLPGLGCLSIDALYGLVAISPKRGLYVIRVSGEIDEEALLAITEVQGIHGDIRISAIDPKTHAED